MERVGHHVCGMFIRVHSLIGHVFNILDSISKIWAHLGSSCRNLGVRVLLIDSGILWLLGIVSGSIFGIDLDFWYIFCYSSYMILCICSNINTIQQNINNNNILLTTNSYYLSVGLLFIKYKLHTNIHMKIYISIIITMKKMWIFSHHLNLIFMFMLKAV